MLAVVLSARSGGSRRDRGGGEYICTYRARHVTERGGYRRIERDLLRRGIYHDHPDLRILADRVYGRYDGALIQGVQYRDRRFGRYLLVRGPYVYTDVGYQAIEEEREEKLVLSEDRAVLRGIEHDLRQVVERVLEP